MKGKILIVGQTPPPYGGQAMMIEQLVKADFKQIDLVHIRMDFSKDFKSVGRFGFKKVLHMFELISKIIYRRFKSNIKVLHYSPAGPNLNPFVRDAIILSFVRPFFKKTIFHFNAAGISDYLRAQPSLVRFVGRQIYGRPAASIQLSKLNPDDGGYFRSERIYFIKNGLEDAALNYLPLQRKNLNGVRILYVGVLNETKGILILLQALKILLDHGVEFSCICIGDFASNQFEVKARNTIRDLHLDNHVSFPGSKTGHEKWKEFVKADIFCFPTFFESESFGNVLVEAMMFELPVVATRWRGVPDIVDEGETGLLVPIKDPHGLASSLMRLAGNAQLRRRMGVLGREKFLREFLLSTHLAKIEETFLEIINSED